MGNIWIINAALNAGPPSDRLRHVFYYFKNLELIILYLITGERVVRKSDQGMMRRETILLN